MSPPPPAPAQITDLAEAINRLARPHVPPALLGRDAAALAGFADEHGHRRHTDDFLLAAALGSPWPANPGPRAPADARLWAACGDPAINVAPLLTPGPSAPLVDHPDPSSVEVMTEVELSALHALWRAARVRGDALLRDRAVEAARWHVAELQPDNATHLPWAAHVFYIAWAKTGEWPLRHHADTLVHNCQVHRGRPDARSALILTDAAAELRLAARASRG